MHHATQSWPLQDPVGQDQWHTALVVTVDPADARVEALRLSTVRYRRAAKAAEDARLAQYRAIATARAAGLRQNQIVAITGYTREHVRRIAAETDPE